MKTLKNLLIMFLALLSAGSLSAQLGGTLQYFPPVGKAGLNTFEPSKVNTVPFQGLQVRVGGDFAMQFQALDQSNAKDSLVQLGKNFNLPTANLNLDVQLHDGVRMHLRTYLSSRHHHESWVKGGYVQIDKLDFIKKGFLENVMNVATMRVGLDEFNYGDAHFRRSDNARAIYNPFVGNFIMDAFSTEAFGELTIQKSGFIGVLGLTNGKLNQSVVVTSTTDNQPSFYGKLGYDNQLNDDLRLRLTGSWYMNNGTSTGFWLYGGDRAGARYYNVMHSLDETRVSDFEPRFNPRFTKLTAIQINPFVKFKGLEFFGIFEMASDGNDGGGAFTQLAGELIYRFGKDENLYIGGRYNSVSGMKTETSPEIMIDRINIGGGWFMTNNMLVKIEYVNQNYSGDGWVGTKYEGASFGGVVAEACISF